MGLQGLARIANNNDDDDTGGRRRMKRREQDGGHDGFAAWLGGNTAEAIPARFHNGGKRIYSAVAFLLFREGREKFGKRAAKLW